jgi:hypothetical protein
MMFLRLADGDGKMTAREIERFDELLASRNWCHSPLLQRSLANTEAEKAELWKQYTAGELRASIDQVAASIDTVLGSLAPEERPDVERDLVQFSLEILKAARAEAGLLHRDKEAKATFDALLDLIKRHSARAAVQTKAKPEAEKKPAVLNLCSLLTGDLSADLFCRPGKLAVRCVQVIEETHDVLTLLAAIAASGNGPSDLTVVRERRGSFLYVLNSGNGTVAPFQINLADGSLIPDP